MNSVHIVRCYRNGQLARSELCMTLWEADMKAKEFMDSGWYDEVKIITTGEDNAELV